MSERENLSEQQPEITAELREVAESWRAGIEDRWTREFSVERQGTVTHKT
jgi:hypothetical protein